MGLDMYLKKKVFIGAQYEHRGITGTIDIADSRGERLDRGLKNLSYLEYDVAYWRKANAVHDWFVRNVQNGVDECQESYVPREKLRELLELAKQALDLYNADKKDECLEILPPASGFFFGTTDLDDWYQYNLEQTIDQLTDALAEAEDDESFYYQSSW